MSDPPSRLTGDVLAGIVAAIVVLPQSMAFGVALFGPAAGAGAGALAGLIGAAALSLASGGVGGTSGLISAPTGPVMALLGGTIAASALRDLPSSSLLASMAAVVALAGLTQVAIGVAGGGHLVKLLPYPVVTGFMTGAAVLMFVGQKKLFFSSDTSGASLHLGLPAITAVVTAFAARLGPRFIRKIPGPVIGLVVGTAVFHLGALVAPVDTEAWLVGALPGPGELRLPLLGAPLSELPWTRLLGDGLALGLLASLDTLLTSVIADVITKDRHRSRRELIGQGLGQVLSAALGGLAGAGTTGATVVAAQSGGRRFVGVVTGAAIALLVVVGGPVGRLLPVPALGGILLAIGWGMVDRDLFAWWKHRQTRLDAVVATVVVIVTVVVDLMVAVGLGVAIATALFLRAEALRPIVLRRATAAQRRSVVRRPRWQRQILEEHDDLVVVASLRGDLYFATADRLFDELRDDLARADVLVLDLRRVTHIDITGIKLLGQLVERMSSRGAALAVAELHKSSGIGRKLKKALRRTSAGRPPKVRTFINVDEALAWAEERVIARFAEEQTTEEKVTLADFDLVARLPPEGLAALTAALEERTVEKGETIFECDEVGEGLYLVLEGSVDIRLPTTDRHYRRLARCGPGTVFGEVAFFDPGPRTARAVAVVPSTLLVLGRERFEQLREEHPQTATDLLLGLARRQGAALRWSAAELKRLAGA